MPANEGFLRDILEHPDDDTPRLVYSDWLEDHGDPARAEFIRLQCALARQAQDSPARREQAFRARTLLDQHWADWLAPLARFELRDVLFRRGFVEKARVKAATLAKHAGELFASCPLRRLWVTNLAIMRAYGDEDVLRHIPADNKLAGLDLCGTVLDAGDLERIADLPTLGALQELGLVFTMLEDEDVWLLGAHPFFGRLSCLRLAGNPLSAETRERLTAELGERVSFVAEREPEHLYPIQNERFVAGFGAGHTQLLLYGTDTELRLTLFDHEGNLLSTQSRPIAQEEAPPGPWSELPMEVRTAWLAERDRQRYQVQDDWLEAVGYQPATIWVKRFRTEDRHGIGDFPLGWLETLEAPGHPEQERALRWMEDWLRQGQFVYDFGESDWWLDDTGDVTST
jgi:uncharacterized protein (TIGR02996 family)